MATQLSPGAFIRKLFAFFKESLTSEHQDFTQGSIRRAVFLLAIPMVMEMSMESVFAIVDIFYVGKLGPGAVAAVGLTESVCTLVYSVAIGVSMAATALVARRVGEKDNLAASKVAAQAVLLTLLIALLVSATGWLLAADLLRWMGAGPDVVAQGTGYTRTIFGGCATVMLLFSINGIYRGAGNASIAMWSLWIANIANIILCPLFIHLYGLTGAAMATVTGRSIGVGYQLFHLLKGTNRLRLLPQYFKPVKSILRSIVSIAATGTFQFLLASASWIILARIMTEFDNVAVAGYQVAIRVILFFILPAWGLSNAAATLVGQNLGAQQPDRAARSVWVTARYSGLFMAMVSLLFLFGAGFIIAFLNKDAAVAKVATEALHIVSLGYVFYGVGMVMTSAFNGAGDTRTPTIINFFGFWLFQVPLAYLLAIRWELGPRGVFLSILLAETGIAIAGILLFRQGKWKKVRV